MLTFEIEIEMALFCKNAWRKSSLVGGSLLFIILLVLMGKLGKDGSGNGVEAWHHKYCFAIVGNKYLLDPQAEKDILNMSGGYTGFGHDVYHTESMEAAIYTGGSNLHYAEFTQKVFHVKEKNGKILFGWFHFRLTHTRTGTGFSLQSIPGKGLSRAVSADPSGNFLRNNKF